MEFTKEMLNDPQALLLLGIPIAKGLVSAIAIFFMAFNRLLTTIGGNKPPKF